MSVIGGIAVNLTANIAAFSSNLTSAAGLLGGVRAAFDRATDSAAAYKNLTASIGELKLAGRDTATSVQNVFATARAELQKFMASSDVQVALEIGREHLAESWLRAKPYLQSLVESSGIKVAASVVADKTQNLRAWIDRQRRAVTKPITVRVELARRALDQQFSGVRSRLESLKAYRAVRITLSAISAVKPVVQAAIATLGPFRRLATTGLTVALRATHAGIATAVTKARSVLGGLSSFGRSVTSALTSGFALVGAGLAALGVYSLGGLIRGSMDSIDAVAKLSDRLGIATEKLGGLQYAADLSGVSADALTGGFEKMLNSISDAATKGGSAGAAFTTLGLDINKLATMAPDEAFGQISDALIAVQNPAQRASLAMDVFGKSGQSLLPLMMSGSEGIAAAQKEAEKLGLTFSRVDAAKVEAANDAMTRLSKVFTGAFQSLAISVAPFVDAASTKLTELASSGGGVGQYVTGAFESIVKGVAAATDYLSLLKAGFKLLQSGATFAVFGIVKAIDFVGSGLTKLLNLLPGVSVQWTDFTGQLADGLLEEARKLQDEAGDAFNNFETGASSKAVSRLFDDIRAGSQQAADQLVGDGQKIGGALRGVSDEAADNLQKVSETLKDISSDVATAGLSDTEKQIAKLRELGASDAQLEQARGLLTVKSQLDGLANIDTGDALGDYATKLQTITQLWGQQKITLEQFNSLRDAAQQTLNDKLADSAKSVIESVQTPLEAYTKEMEKLQTLLDQHLISQDVFDRAKLKAKDTLDAANKKQSDSIDANTPKALRVGSADAQRLAYDAARGVRQTIGRDEIAKRQLTTQEQMARSLTDIARSSRADRSVAVEEVDL